jgi:hypothetical protein
MQQLQKGTIPRWYKAMQGTIQQFFARTTLPLTMKLRTRALEEKLKEQLVLTLVYLDIMLSEGIPVRYSRGLDTSPEETVRLAHPAGKVTNTVVVVKDSVTQRVLLASLVLLTVT